MGGHHPCPGHREGAKDSATRGGADIQRADEEGAEAVAEVPHLAGEGEGLPLLPLGGAVRGQRVGGRHEERLPGGPQDGPRPPSAAKPCEKKKILFSGSLLPKELTSFSVSPFLPSFFLKMLCKMFLLPLRRFLFISFSATPQKTLLGFLRILWCSQKST